MKKLQAKDHLPNLKKWQTIWVKVEVVQTTDDIGMPDWIEVSSQHETFSIGKDDIIMIEEPEKPTAKQ
jgi:hypothetical protein